MRILLAVIATTGLVLTLFPSFFLFAGLLDWNTHVHLMFIGMITWFFTAPFLMKMKSKRTEVNAD